MFLGAIGEFFSSLAGIYWKKALAMNSSLSSLAFMLFGWSVPMIAVIGMSVYFNISLLPFGDKGYIGVLVLLIIIMSLIKEPLRQYTMRREKFSVILPYSRLNSALSIILSFYIFGDVSVISFFIAIGIVAIITAFSIDFSSIKIPKTLGVFLVHEMFLTGGVLLTGYVLSQTEFLNFYIGMTSMTVIILLIYLCFRREITGMVQQSKVFYITRIGAAILGTLGYFISLYIMSELGVIMSILLGFLGVVFSLIFSFLLLGDRPSMKNISMGVIITLLVGAAFYYK